VTHLAAPVSFCANNRDGALATVAPARHFPARESNNDSVPYSATWLRQQPYLPCGIPLLNSSAECDDCSGLEQKTLCNGDTCTMKARSWRGATTPAYPPSRAQALSSSPSKTKIKAEEELFVLKMVEENAGPRRRIAGRSATKSPLSNR